MVKVILPSEGWWAPRATVQRAYGNFSLMGHASARHAGDNDGINRGPHWGYPTTPFDNPYIREVTCPTPKWGVTSGVPCCARGPKVFTVYLRITFTGYSMGFV